MTAKSKSKKPAPPSAASAFSGAHQGVILPAATPASGTLGTASVIIQAGHVNTPDNRTGASGSHGEERVWNRIVRDEAAQILEQHGVDVIATDASWKRAAPGKLLFKGKLAVFLHFDGDKEDHKTEGASVGYPSGSANSALGAAWKSLYARYWPYQWKDDNYSTNESGYYGYRHIQAQHGQIVIEFGDNEDEQQSAWLAPRLKWLGALLAYFLDQQLGNNNVPLPEAPAPEHFSLFDEAGGLAIHLPSTGNPQRLPDYAAGMLDEASGIPWSKAGAMPQYNGYDGMIKDSFYVFHNVEALPAKTAIWYESKFAIDNDGAGGNEGGDPDHQNNTSLRHENGTSLNAARDPFAVIPMDRAQAEKEHERDPRIALKHPGLPDFGALGLGLGDVGVTFWRRAKHGPVRRAFFAYADEGPANKLGEGSMLLADQLDIDSDPNHGGIATKEIHEMGKGVVHIVFPGSGDVTVGEDGLPRTRRSREEVVALAGKLFETFRHG